MPREMRAKTTSPQYPGLGDSRTLSTQTQNNRGQAISQQAMTEEGGVYTLAFSVQPPIDDTGVLVPYVCEAIVKASEEGNTIQRRFYVINGTSISVPARIIDIRIRDATPAEFSGETVPGAGSEYIVSVVGQRGTRPYGSKPPTLSEPAFSIASTLFTTFDIPGDAGVTTVEVALSNPITGLSVPATVEFLAGAGVVKAYAPSTTPEFVVIPAGATQVRITNFDGTNSVFATVTWGIDG